jgi:hypothetical protein
LVVLVALGPAAPTFIKSYAVARTHGESTLAALAIMESLGGLISPVILAMAQSFLRQGSVFIAAAGTVSIAII